MGDKLLSVTLMTLLMFLGIDWFARWYDKFLQKSVMSFKFRKLIIRFVWVISATLFWIALYKKAMPDVFSMTHFAFALFVFSLYGLFKTVFTREPS